MFKTIERDVNFIIDITSAWPPKGSIRIYIYLWLFIYVSILCKKSRSVNWVNSSVLSDFKYTVYNTFGKTWQYQIPCKRHHCWNMVDVPEIPAFFLKVCEEDYSSIQFRFDTSYLQGLFSGKSIRTLFFHGWESNKERWGERWWKICVFRVSRFAPQISPLIQDGMFQLGCHVLRTCSICYEDMIPEHHDVAELPCKHHFHHECVGRWLGMGKPHCPLCWHHLAWLGVREIAG